MIPPRALWWWTRNTFKFLLWWLRATPEQRAYRLGEFYIDLGTFIEIERLVREAERG